MVPRLISYELLKFLHVIGATVILGTGSGIAFFMFMAHRTADATFVAGTSKTVVTADAVFTLTAVLLQPLTGWLLARDAGLPLTTPWIAASIGLYLVAGLAWLPVVAVQIRMRDLALKAAASGTTLPPAYSRQFRTWFLLGIPGFGATLAIVWLMVAKPALWP